jgi:hypothetical protein
MHNRGIIIPNIQIPTVLGGGVGEALSFTMPPQYHILQYKVPFYFNGIIFWFEEIHLRKDVPRRENYAKLCIEGRRRNKEIKIGIPFYIRRGGFAMLNREIGPAEVHVIRQIGIY